MLASLPSPTVTETGLVPAGGFTNVYMYKVRPSKKVLVTDAGTVPPYVMVGSAVPFTLNAMTATELDNPAETLWLMLKEVPSPTLPVDT